MNTLITAGTWLAYTIIATRKDYFNQLIELQVAFVVFAVVMLHTYILQHLLTVTNTLTAVTDIAISAVMIYLLQISKTGFQRSTDLLNRLIIFTFGTGLPTALSALLSAITANTNPNTLIYALFNAFLGRFYTNCLLVNLNARDYIRGMNNTTLSDVEDIQLSARSCSSRNGTRSNTFRINVETTTNVFRSVGIFVFHGGYFSDGGGGGVQDTNANNTMDILRSYDSKGEP
ncbi:hypothetical protein FISHEDRAFT_73274 [Fistulina hepatica ATCC 64428]|uniref:DUF6534 domain-containing protein n=1 Tax=Fistulina hepatica ATCC 64428 TaxID=1128425 RepID=A0A0D7AG11_9AGAR|nr:hypothetical protein FISHEDRAFT_73274 [Fistulina hepatica ATCC 64428]